MAYRKVDFSKLVVADGTAISTSNCAPAGSGNTNFNEVLAVGTSRSLTKETLSGDAIARASVPNGAADDGNIQMRYYCSGQTQMSCSARFRGGQAVPNVDARSIEFSTPLGYAMRLEIDTSGVMLVYTPGTGSNNDMVGTVAVDAAGGYRVWTECTLGADGSQTIRAVLFNASTDPDLDVASDTLVSTTATTRDATTFDQARFGLINNAGEATFDYADIQLEDAALGDLGPLVDPPTVTGTGTDLLAVDVSANVTGGAGGPYTIDSVTQTVGTAVTGLSHKDDAPLMFWVNRASVVDHCEFEVHFADSASNPTVTPLTVAVEPGNSAGAGIARWSGVAWE